MHKTESPVPDTMRSGFDRGTFEQFIDMRIGSGEPVCWYGCGVVNGYPKGEVLCRLEGVELMRLYRPDPDVPLAYQYSRNFVVFRDAKTNEIMCDSSGQARMIAQPYQYLTYTLDGDVLRYESERGSGADVLRISGGDNTEVRTVGDVTIVTSPAWLDTPSDRHWEKYDFIVAGGACEAPRFQIVWGRYGPNFDFLGTGFSTAHMWLYRFDGYEVLPQSIRTVIENEAGMALWKMPPSNLDEIRDLQYPDDRKVAVGS